MIQGTIPFRVQTKVLPTKGHLVYEYNPFRNYRLTESKFEYKEMFYTLDELASNFKITVDDADHPQNWYRDGQLDESLKNQIILHEKGQLVDFDTSELSFDLEHPVNIVPQYSYDGSVNLILNDGINQPRLINSRFSATGMNTYEIVDRKGNNDTNIYDQGEQFDIDTSLYKRVVSIPKLSFNGVTSGGNLPVGNYHFYIKLSDADGNETDFVAESGLVSVFIGFGAPNSLTSGNKNENSYKGVNLFLSNIDPSYDYLYVYYSRSTAEGQENFVTEYKKIDKKFVVTNAGTCSAYITGFESTVELTSQDINLNYQVVDAAKAQTQCQNMLMLGNVHKPEIPYKELSDLALHFCPYLKNKEYECSIDQNYTINTSSQGYFNPQYIYSYVGYWNKEYYRLGVVFILNNGELSPVFNIRGCSNMQPYSEDSTKSFKYADIKVWKDDERNYIDYNETNFLINTQAASDASDENVKGVIKLASASDTNQIHSLDIRIDSDAVNELKKYVSGFFFVRQPRIPTILAQGVTIGVDQTAYTPTIPTADGCLTQLSGSLDRTYVTTNDINDVNYISEGFLSRYAFKFKKKSSSLWSKIGKIAAVTVGVVALAAATVFTAGAVGAVAAGATLSGVVTAGGSAISAALTAAGVASSALGIAGTTAVIAVGSGVAAGVAATTIAGLQEAKYGIQSWQRKKLDGRNTKCPGGYKIVEIEDSRKLTQSFIDRLIIKDSSKNKVQAIICPDYELNQAYYNQIFTGNEHLIETTNSQGSNLLMGHSSNYFSQDMLNNNRHYYMPNYYDTGVESSGTYKIIAVPDNTKCVGMDDIKFRSRAGEAEEAWRYECIGDDYKSDYSKNNADEDSETISNKKINSDIIRGSYGAYLGVNNTGTKLAAATTVNIYIPKYDQTNITNYMRIRMDDNSTYEAITDRIAISDLEDYLVNKKSELVDDANIVDAGYQFGAFRGDCYICQFTHRINRNFNDPSAPYNDEIVDEDSWKDNYNPEKTEDYQNINLGDVNAIQLGTWVTFRVRSSYNLNIRTLDGANVDESLMTGHPRGYFPYQPMSTEGTFKTPESQIYNKGFSKSLSERWNNLLPDVPYIKNWFGTRIMYSDIHINDAYKNGFRVFQGTHYRDYTREYGEIVKLISLESNLLVIFEHGIALIEVNAQAQQNGQYISVPNVLSEKPIVLSDTFGSQWADSILKVPGKTGDSAQYVYGVDTVAKKIWCTDGRSVSCISDYKVQEFLNNNITLGERELTPKMGIRNVKTVYNAFKRDVLFTFYDNTYGFEEKVWNLCYNELLKKFITFYSWVPSYMENINNIPFSFDRNTSKWIAKLGVSHSENSFADGITLSNVIVENSVNDNGEVVSNFSVPVSYINKEGKWVTKNYVVAEKSRKKYIGVFSLSNRTLPDSQLYYQISYSLQRDQYGNYKKFEIVPMTGNAEGGVTLPDDAMYPRAFMPLYGLKFKEGEEEYTEVYYKDNNELTLTSDGAGGTFYTYQALYTPKALLAEMYYRNKEGHAYADYDVNKVKIGDIVDDKVLELEDVLDYPIFKDITGKRPTLPREEMINADKIVTLLNVRATITIIDEDNNNKLSDAYYNIKAGYNSSTSLINAGYYESTIGIAPKWNLQFLSTDFWKHGQAGLIDIADDIYPTYWYGKQHPFEFECIVVNDPSVHKIFTNLELVANKAKPESFHYEIIGESYDFAKDKVNMYFRQEAMKALWQYNGADISYNRNFLKVQPRQQPKSADLPHKYYTRQDTINEIEDYYIHVTYPDTHDYKHLSGAEIVYYPNRQEYRIWNHAMAVSLDDLSQDDSRSIISANCKYLEDRWKITINPILVCYKNEYQKKVQGSLIQPLNSTWAKAKDSSQMLPPLPIYNSPIPDQVLSSGGIDFPGVDENHPEWGKDNALYDLYDMSNFNSAGGWKPLDLTNWLDDVNIYKYNFGEAHNRKELDVKDKFLKIRIRYSGEELAVIDFLNTVYRISFS